MINKKLEQNIYLIGFMAAGKSTIGKKLAETLNFSFIDLDDWLEVGEKQTISDMFSQHGEAFFREKEQIYLHKTAHLKAHIIATGGGTPCYFDSMAHIKQLGTSFYLQSSAQMLAERLMQERAKRPLANGFDNLKDLEIFVQQKLQTRKKHYEQADKIIFTQHKSIKNIIDEMIGFLQT